MTALLLDVGVVLLKSAWEIADEFERLTGIPERTIPGRGPFDDGGDALWQRHRAGELTEREYWLGNADVAVRRGAPLLGHPHLMRAMFQHPGIDPARPEAVALLRRAREAGITTAIFSNELMDFQGREWVEAQPWFPLFDFVYDATERGVRKPDPRAYAEIIAEIGLPAGDLVFVDDNPRYVEGGTASGMRSVLLDVLHPVGAFDAAARLLRLDT
ncbi:MAG TPA: HAD-IA family hydrolase [Marmoricola sp.]|nr:HAD-IA family hydrolase [Marmoricola sp.]